MVLLFLQITQLSNQSINHEKKKCGKTKTKILNETAHQMTRQKKKPLFDALLTSHYHVMVTSEIKKKRKGKKDFKDALVSRPASLQHLQQMQMQMQMQVQTRKKEW